MEKDTPPNNSKRVYRVSDLPPDRSPARYRVKNDGDEPKVITFQKRKRQVLELLMGAPVYAASPVRLSDMVHLLKLEDGIDIETKMYPGDPGTGTLRYGVYFLRSKVSLAENERMAA